LRLEAETFSQLTVRLKTAAKSWWLCEAESQAEWAVSEDWLQWLVMNLCASLGCFWRLIVVVGNEFVCISGQFLKIDCTGQQWICAHLRGFLKIDCSGQQWICLHLWAVSDESADREAKLMIFHLLTMMIDLIQLLCWKIGPSQRHTCHTSEVVSSWVTLQSCQVSKWVLNQEHSQKFADCHWKMASLWTINDWAHNPSGRSCTSVPGEGVGSWAKLSCFLADLRIYV
jgi:hypothetical protein